MTPPKVPARLALRPRDARGYVVPFFVAWKDGRPDFRVADAARAIECIRFRRCWICGSKLGRYYAFVAGPVSTITHGRLSLLQDKQKKKPAKRKATRRAKK